MGEPKTTNTYPKFLITEQKAEPSMAWCTSIIPYSGGRRIRAQSWLCYITSRRIITKAMSLKGPGFYPHPGITPHTQHHGTHLPSQFSGGRSNIKEWKATLASQQVLSQPGMYEILSQRQWLKQKSPTCSTQEATVLRGGLFQRVQLRGW